MSLLDQIEGAQRRRLNPSGGCHNCPRRRVDYVPATLRSGPVLWLGEAPGATEVVEQEGFVGESGKLLRREAAAAGVPEPWSFSNAIHCRPPENAAPKPREVECCLSQFVLGEVRDYPFVVLVGAVPLQALFPRAVASHFRGNVAHHPDFPGQRFYAIYHPSYMLRRPDLLDLFRRHLERLGRIVRGEDVQRWSVVRGQAGLEALHRMTAGHALAFDLETPGVESWTVDFRIESVAATADGVTVAAFHESEPWFRGALELLRDFAARRAASVTGANVAFDLEVMERELGFRAQCQVQALETIWYEAAQYKQVSLKRLVAEELDGYRYLVHEPHTLRDPELLVRYDAEDAAHSWDLFVLGMQRARPGGRDLATRVLGPATLLFRRAQAHGLYFRRDYQRGKLREYEERRRAAVEAWHAADPGFVPTRHEAGHGLRHYLFELKGLRADAYTATGEPVTDKAQVKRWIRAGHDYLEHLLTVRSIDKLTSTYLKGYDEHVWPDGRLRPSFWLNSTDTSRPSSSNPNVFNVARDDEVRDLFGAPAGSVLVESDLSQIEFRIMVCLARDEQGIEGYLRGEDAHTMTARTITGKEHPSKDDRSLAKPVNFGCLYGGGAGMVQQYAADEYGVIWTDAQAQAFVDGFLRTYPGIPVFHDAARAKLLANRGWFESVTGHSWRYADWDSPDRGRQDHAFRAALNSEAQGPAANICLYIGVLARELLDRRGLRRVALVNSVYDSLMHEVPDPATVPDVIACVEEACGLAYEWVRRWFVVPLVMEHAVGESWGSLQKWAARA